MKIIKNNTVFVHTECNFVTNDRYRMGTPKEHVNQKEKEVFLIVIANTIIDPWTMVVHSCYATLANRAMMAGWSLQSIALFAFLCQSLFKKLHLLQWELLTALNLVIDILLIPIFIVFCKDLQLCVTLTANIFIVITTYSLQIRWISVIKILNIS